MKIESIPHKVVFPTIAKMLMVLGGWHCPGLGISRPLLSVPFIVPHVVHVGQEAGVS